MDEALLLALLDRLEEQELPLLTWGLVDSAFTEEEIQEHAQTVLDAADDWSDPIDLVLSLEARRLLFRFTDPYGCPRFRTRFAEAVRLLSQLRQLFSASEWSTGPRLVADFRLIARRRRYPARSLDWDAVLARVSAAHSLGPEERSALAALLNEGNRAGMRLADFQARATGRILAAIAPGRRADGGTLVSAGTGTGKTLAFYAPCLTAIASRLEAEPWTQAVAIYPRNELLKDQLSEALREARRLRGKTARPLRIGAFFGPTPRQPNPLSVQGKEWAPAGGGYLCPYLRCPRCEGDLVWPGAALQQGEERLECRACGEAVGGDEVMLTRDRMQREPPDLLFTTTEMLNRQLCNDWSARLFGVAQPRERSPFLMLLDEVHTYSGTHGAQVALLLRRWRQAVRHPVHFVGLSATLTSPEAFFAQLTGLDEERVAVIGAREPLEEEGREYLLVLRGDPVSGTSLLSTSIQAALLLGRVLDPPDAAATGGVYGQKLFAFTDDLDVTNRLFHSLLDAEGRDSRGYPMTRKDTLAALRRSGQDAHRERFQEGQAWPLCEWIGHELAPAARRQQVGRTSSQDTGVDGRASVIVATASLEVGYNDPRVGMILQHKAPRDAAAFLQRKGRAGRRRITRPWTVVVLSDYGRDRFAYQAFDQLFDPELEKAALPVRNRYVLRMQAVYALLEWLGARLREVNRGSAWDDLTRPAQDSRGVERQERAAEVIQELLVSPREQADLARHLEHALRIDAGEVTALLWEPPRALLTAVLPTALRRLRTGWRCVQMRTDDPEYDRMAATSPLPDFAPSNLFSDLNLPEVAIDLPAPAGSAEEETVPALPIVQALSTLAPGRVTRRFGVVSIHHSHWVAPASHTDRHQDLALHTFCTQLEALGAYQYQDEVTGETVTVRCARPWRLRAVQIPAEVRNTSNARLRWRSQLYFETELSEEQQGDVPANSPFAELVTTVTFFTHNQERPLRVRRFTTGSLASLRLQNGTEHALEIRLTEGAAGSPAALGYELEVDGILFRCRIPDEWVRRALMGERLRESRVAFFRDLATGDPHLLAAAAQNSFRLQWAVEVFLALLVARAVRNDLPLQEAAGRLAEAKWERSVLEALDSIFQVVDTSGEEDGEAGESSAPGRVHDAVRQLLLEPEVRLRLLELAATLWEPPDTHWERWMRRRLKSTLGAALLAACTEIASEFQAADLILDLESGPVPDGGQALEGEEEALWITETVLGGGGVVEEIFRRYQEDPRQFYLLVGAALGPSDFEVVDAELTRIVDRIPASAPLAAAFAGVRQAGSNQEHREAHAVLLETLLEEGVAVTHPVVTAINARLLRPGSSSGMDELLRELLQRWRAAEAALHVDIDARVFAYCAAHDPAIRELLRTHLGSLLEGGHQSGRYYGVLYSLLWPRGVSLRERALECYSPYADLPRTDRALLAAELRALVPELSVERDDWRERLPELLANRGAARLVAAAGDRESLHAALLWTGATAVELGFLRVYPFVGEVDVTPDGCSALVYLRGAQS